MLNPKPIPFVCQLPVAALDPRPTPNRVSRRRRVHGKQTHQNKMRGRLAPKQAREAGL